MCVLVVIAAVLIFLPAVSAADGVNSPGYIDVSSNPSGALVYVDGTYEGSTPTTVTVESGFSHSVEVTYVGYNSYSTYASPDSGE
ncbi:MAG TPA: PEGA domain-containing protein, partial [Methanocorpusculum sp.]|nr:PEGA domain-containing protein [Methanocorpusculum sp.]